MKMIERDEIEWAPGTRFEIKCALVDAINSRTRVRLFLGDPNTGRDWCEERDTMGYIGVSLGRKKVPLLLANSRSSGGPQISTAHVLRVTVGRRVVTSHPKYQVPELEVRGHEVLRNGEVVARHKSEKKARSWVRFMRGEADRWG